MNDPGIKLFGKKIALPGIGNIPATVGQDFGVMALHQVDSSDHASRTCLEDDRMNEIEEKGGQEAEKVQYLYNTIHKHVIYIHTYIHSTTIVRHLMTRQSS